MSDRIKNQQLVDLAQQTIIVDVSLKLETANRFSYSFCHPSIAKSFFIRIDRNSVWKLDQSLKFLLVSSPSR